MMANRSSPLALTIGLGMMLVTIAALPACQEASRSRTATPEASPSVAAYPTLPPSPSPATGGGQVPAVGGETKDCAAPSPAVVTACKALTPPATDCDAKPIPAETCDRIVMPTTGAAPGGKTCLVTVQSSLNVRPSPSTSEAPIGSMGPGESFTFVEESNGWVKGKTQGGLEGWACDSCKSPDDYLNCESGGMQLFDPKASPNRFPNPDGSFG
jgi:hypothetical protein